MGMVTKIKVYPSCTMVTMIDESGQAQAFADVNTQIEVGQMYVMLIGGKTILRYITPDELNEGKGGIFRTYLAKSSFPDVPPGMLKVIAFKTRTTKAGAKMGTATFCDADKHLISALVFPQKFKKAYEAFQPGAVVDVKLSELDDGYAVANIL